MKCSKCNKNEASVYYKQNINGEIKEYALCAECAKAEEFDLSVPFAHLNLFGSRAMPVKGIEKKRCNLCGCSFEDIRRSGKVGCGYCYDVFSDELKGTITSIHGSASHIARTSDPVHAAEDYTSRIEKLKNDLTKAIEAEEYERAAELRDKIRELEGKGNV